MAEKQLTSVTKLYKLYPKAKPGIFEILDTEMTKENFTLIDKENFLAQAAHESNGFSTFVENLNYSADGLRRVFGKYFKNKDINYYARNPERIGSLVYANRMGNGDEQSKDGYRYRGRGIFQHQLWSAARWQGHHRDTLERERSREVDNHAEVERPWVQ